jgi:hypothetical protein
MVVGPHTATQTLVKLYANEPEEQLFTQVLVSLDPYMLGVEGHVATHVDDAK